MSCAANKSYKKLLDLSKEKVDENLQNINIEILVGAATCENAAGANLVFEKLNTLVSNSKRNDILIKKVGCTGRCSLEPILSVLDKTKSGLTTYAQVDEKKLEEIFLSHIIEDRPLKKYFLNDDSCKVLEVKKTEEQKKLAEEPILHEFFEFYGDKPFYCSQTRIALRNAGVIDPENIYEYVKNQGFAALAKVLEKNDPNYSLNEVIKSNLRGRGGAGFPTGKKWSFAINTKEKERYMICNADEGDPGAFMDRSMLESDPFSVIEGMIIAGYVIGAKKGFFYIRAEYPLAIERIEKAIESCKQNGLLGKNILGTDFNYDLEIRLGAGAFVCGEETALINSIEGERGQPRLKPPFPAIEGLWEKPTIINNVETLANLPVILSIGGEKFSQIGSKKSGGTKVFAVSGKVKHTGLVEVPLGTTIKELVFDICGGVPNGKKIKAVLTGGPAGGCIPKHLLDTPIDFDSLTSLGTIMGSGGLIVLDEDDCMVHLAHFFMTFTQDESCGKCTPCREGTYRLLEILDRIIKGAGELEDLDKLERLGKVIQKSALCGLGKSAPNPILSTLKYFKAEYLSHVEKKVCPVKKCSNLIHYEIDENKCVGCTACAKNCPVACISGEVKKAHKIDQSKCIKCGTCFEVCRFNAVKIK